MSTWIQVEGTSYVGKLGKLFRRVFSMLHSLSLFLEILNFVFLYTDSGLSSAHGNGDSVVHLERSDQLSLFGYTAFSYRGIHSYEVPDDCFHVERRTSIVDIRDRYLLTSLTYTRLMSSFVSKYVLFPGRDSTCAHNNVYEPLKSRA